MKREDAIYKAYSKLMGIKYDNINYVDSFYIHRPEVIKFTNELFDHIESIEAENQELKEKLDESYVRYTKETSRLEQRNGNLEAKLEAIQSNKIAEFSGEVCKGKNGDIFIDNGIDNYMCHSEMPVGEICTVTISKDKQ